MTSFWQRHTLQSAGHCEGTGVCGDCYPDACPGYRREHHDLQLDQCDIAESSSRTCPPERGCVADPEQARGESLPAYLS
jgi:hypothetical protein